MKLVLIHGRAQGDRSAMEIEREWTEALGRGYAAASIGPPSNVEVVVPFYGAMLDALTEEIHKRAQEIVARGNRIPEGMDPFQFEILMALKEEAGISDTEVAAEMRSEVVERGPANWEFVQATFRLLSRRTSLSKAVIATFLSDVDSYLNYAHVADQINSEVKKAIHNTGECVVVGHSLGSVVSYAVLTQLAGSEDVRLLVTLGSPLGIPAIRNTLPRPLGIPKGVVRWLNAADEADVVALFSRLDGETFVEGIENIKVDNPRDKEHWIGGYLAQAVVAENIASALREKKPPQGNM